LYEALSEHRLLDRALAALPGPVLAGLRAWFQQDDFAWLSLGSSVTDLPSLMRALFVPMAQGTIRPLSERAFFLVFHAIFGLWATLSARRSS